MNKKILLFHLKTQEIGLVLLLIAFVFVKWKSLYILPWSDEAFYPDIVRKEWSFFLPWNYRPEEFMGHPMLQPLVTYIAFKLFGVKILVAKATTLSFSLLCLFSLYKMTKALFQDEWAAFLSVFITICIPRFWFYSTLVLAHMPLMAFGFGTIYTFLSGKYKTLLLFSFGLATVRESALAFFVPLLLYGLFIPSYRKAFYCIIPSFLLFLSHFWIFFIRTGIWFSHPYIYGGLPHTPDPVFLDFSSFFERSNRFFDDIFFQFPYLFWGWFLFCLGFFIFSKMKLKRKIKLNKYIHVQNLRQWLQKFFIPLSVSILFFFFWISYPEYSFRNFFPIPIIFTSLSAHLMTKTTFLSPIILTLICCLLFLQNVFPKSSFIISMFGAGVTPSGFHIEEEYKQITVKAKSFASYLEEKYGNKLIKLEKHLYMPVCYEQTMIGPEYGYVKNSYNAEHWGFMDEPERYGIVVFIQEDIPYLSHDLSHDKLVHKYLKESNSFIEQPLPSHLRDFILFVHQDMLD